MDYFFIYLNIKLFLWIQFKIFLYWHLLHFYVNFQKCYFCFATLFSIIFSYWLLKKMTFKVVFVSGKLYWSCLFVCIFLFCFFCFFIDDLHIDALQIMMFLSNPSSPYFLLSFYSCDQDLQYYIKQYLWIQCPFDLILCCNTTYLSVVKLLQLEFHNFWCDFFH